MSDNLATAAQRAERYDDLVAGVPLANRLLGLAIPAPSPQHWRPEALLAPEAKRADKAYAQLFGALFDTPVSCESDWWPLLARLRSLLDPALAIDPLPACYDEVVRTARFSQEELVGEIRQAMTVRRLDFASLFRGPGFVQVKVNHYHWEYISHLALAARGLPVFRPLKAQDTADWQACAVDELFIQVLRRQAARLQANGAAPGDFDNDSFSFGIGFQNGDGHLSDDLVTPIPDTYWSLYRGAMCGSLAFFRGLFPAPHYRFSDGGFPKMLIWENRIHEFIACASATADVVVFIVPDALRHICIRDWTVKTEVIVVPSTRVHELWPAVLPTVLAHLARLFRQNRNVCVLAQAGFMAAPLGMAVNLMRDEFPATRVYFFDMGQALDVAAFPDHPSGPWLRQPDIQGMLRGIGEFPIGLDLPQDP